MRAAAISRRRRAVDPTCLVRWTFFRRGSALTCQVHVNRTKPSFDVCVVPHWDVASAVVEAVDNPVRALQRHAEIVKQLREAGWSLVERTR